MEVAYVCVWSVHREKDNRPHSPPPPSLCNKPHATTEKRKRHSRGPSRSMSVQKMALRAASTP